MQSCEKLQKLLFYWDFGGFFNNRYGESYVVLAKIHHTIIKKRIIFNYGVKNISLLSRSRVGRIYVTGS